MVLQAYLTSLALLPPCLASWIPQQLLSPAESSKPTLKPNLPLVIWHGLGDKYAIQQAFHAGELIYLCSYRADGLRSLESIINETIGPTYTYFIRVDEDASADSQGSFLGNLTTQVTKVCEDLASHPILSKAPAVNALGFSQGGQFMRAYVERCNSPKVASLVTFGSQHNGISAFQNCASDDWLCRSWTGILKSNTWSDLVQRTVVPAQYFRDPEDLDSYLEHSNFLADINNERKVKNSTYKENLEKLESFAMYLFVNDTTVVPKESGWFAEVNTTSDEVTKLQDRPIYTEDWLGLKSLDEAGKLHFNTITGAHMQFDGETFGEVAKKYFKAA